MLANRLSESGQQKVLVLEAGPEPTVVAAYETPGGNQFLSGISGCFIIDIKLLLIVFLRNCDRLEFLYCRAAEFGWTGLGVPS